MSVAEQREIEDVLRGLIGKGFIGTQDNLRQSLEKNGISCNQSTVSRALKRIGAIRVKKNGQSTYVLGPDQHLRVDRFRRLITEVLDNKSIVVVKTIPGAAMFVAGFLDHHCKKDILGSVAGDDTIFIAPNDDTDVRWLKDKILRD